MRETSYLSCAHVQLGGSCLPNQGPAQPPYMAWESTGKVGKVGQLASTVLSKMKPPAVWLLKIS